MITINDLAPMLDAIKADYAKFMTNITDITDKSYRDEQIQRFNEALRVDEGKSYLKIVKDGSVHSFVVKADGGKFKACDILFPASFKAPAKNSARGNVFNDLSRVRWSTTQ